VIKAIRYAVQPFSRSINETSTGAALSGKENPACVRPWEVSTNTGYRRVFITHAFLARRRVLSVDRGICRHSIRQFPTTGLTSRGLCSHFVLMVKTGAVLIPRPVLIYSRVTSSPRRSLWAWRGGSDRSAVAVATCAVCPRETFPRCCKLLQQPFRPHHHGTAAQRRCYIPQCHANALRQTLPDFSRVPKTTVPSPNSSPSTRTPTNMQICRLTA